MYKKIDKDNKIFNSENFLKDEYKFNLIFKNLSSPELELYSDEESYMFCRGAKNLPTWIWTSYDFDKSKILVTKVIASSFSSKHIISLYLLKVKFPPGVEPIITSVS